MKGCTISIAAMVFISPLYSQNLVPDSSFENVNIDNLLCKWTLQINDFENQMYDWTNPTDATPDIHSLLVDSACWSFAFPNIYPGVVTPWDDCSMGEQMPRTGVVMAGLFIKDDWSENYREYIHCQLISPLEKGRFYSVKYYVSLSDFSKFAASRFGAYFSSNEVDTITFSDRLAYSPQFEHAGVINNDTSWTKVEGIFEAKAAWQYLTIGNFKPDSLTQTIWHSDVCREASYYYIDDVSVIIIPMQIEGDSVVCFGESVYLTGKNTSVFAWAEISNPEMIISTEPILTVAPQSNTTYLLCGSQDTVYFPIRVIPSPVLEYSDTCNMNWAEIELSAEGGKPPYSFHWNNGSTLAMRSLLNDGLHQATVTDANQCEDSISVVTICVEQGAIIKVPTGFTPNNDGKNDFLPVFGDASIIANYRFSIYNRWGNTVYYTENPGSISSGDTQRGWDGTYNGTPQDMGVYVYYLNVEFVNGMKTSLTGNITLIR